MAAAEKQKLPVLRITHREFKKRCRHLEDSTLSPSVQRSSSGDLLEDSSTENEGSSAATSDGCKDTPFQIPPVGSGSKSGGGLLHIKPTTTPSKEKKRPRRSNPRKKWSDDHGESDEYARDVSQGATNYPPKPTTGKLWNPDEKPRRGSGSKAGEAGTNRTERLNKDSRLKGKEPTEKDSYLAEWKCFSDGKIKRVLSKWTGDAVKLQQIVQMCENLQEAGENLLLNNLELSTKQEVGSKMWKLGHYPITESLRKQTDDTESLRGKLEEFLKSTTQFYTSLMEKLQSTYQFQLQHLLSGKMDFQSKTHNRTVMMALNVCEWCCICLGDCSRYEQQLSNTPNWTIPQSFYLTAQQLAPKDGKPYNQLALVALNTHVRLDAVYYYMRSLMAKVPFQSAHDSLIGIFEDTSRKAKKQEAADKLATEKAEREALRKRHKMEKQQRKKQRHHHKHSQKYNHSKGKHIIEFPSGRKEVWIFPDSQGNCVGPSGAENSKVELSEELVKAGTLEDVEFEDLTLAELLKKLISAFLVVHGKIFTKIGIETFDHSQEKLLKLWKHVLERDRTFNDSVLFVRMMLISIFSIHNAAENHHANEAMEYYCSLGISLSLHLATSLLSTSEALLDDYTSVSLSHQLASTSVSVPTEYQTQSQASRDIKSDEEIHQCSPLKQHEQEHVPLETDSLAVLLPAIRVWFEWLTHQYDLYEQCLTSVDSSTIHEFWRTTCTFLNKACSTFPHVFDQSVVNSKNTRLWEDRVLAGFMPLNSSTSVQDTYSIQHVDELTPEQHRQQCLIRIALIFHKLKLLCGDNESSSVGGQTVLTFDEISGEFIAKLMPSSPPPAGDDDSRSSEVQDEVTAIKRVNSGEDDKSSSSSSDSEDVIVEEEESEEECDEGAASSEIKLLKEQREILTKQIEKHDIAVETAKTVLSEAASKASQEVHITPKYLVPDTNCFVDMLVSIKTLVHSTSFTVAIPLIVLTELEGLSKGSLESSQRENSERVTSGAKAALEYISATFTAKNSHLKALTTQGSLLNSLSFRAELTDKVSNDDLILESCLQLHTKVSGRKANEKGVESYSVVLLTDDRNLRVKAHAKSMPTRDTPDFMRLVQLHLPM